jgi:two-component system chemotaxis family response regulator WspR
LRELTMFEISLLAFSFLALYLAECNCRLHQETRLDALTGLPNRRAMEERAALQVRFAERTRTPLTLLMMDLDAFKALNDTWGHVVGDRALRAVGSVLLTAAVGTRYTVARLGGEEFAVLLPGHSLSAAQVLAEHLRSTIAAIIVPEDGCQVSVTASIGVAAWEAGESTWTDMLHRADTALYRAKREGRNRVVLFTEMHHAPEASGHTRLRDHAEETSCVVAD